jgi:polyhydroxyalkanoate synthesis regulator phasin
MNEQTYTLELGEQLSRHLRNMGELLDVIAKLAERVSDLEREVAVLDARTRGAL